MKPMPSLYFLPLLLFSSTSLEAQNKPHNQEILLPSPAAYCAEGSGIPSRLKNIQHALAPTTALQNLGEMVKIVGGKFEMGSTSYRDAVPIHEVIVADFLMDAHEVTNAQFAAFVNATGYITVAEQALNPKEFPGVPLELLKAGSAVFTPPKEVFGLANHMQWWEFVTAANWRHPAGPQSSIVGKENHPVVQIAYPDAIAYATWAGKRLPTEAEWEYAARAGQSSPQTYYWGDELKPQGRWQANIYQGQFPINDSAEDGFQGTAPVGSYSANAFGLYDMEGNVWEWCADFYSPDYYTYSTAVNPLGPAVSYDPQEPKAVKRVQRGGSFLCNDQYCERYKAGSRGKGEINSPTNNVGFRCVKDL